jgi:hypothetical protein
MINVGRRVVAAAWSFYFFFFNQFLKSGYLQASDVGAASARHVSSVKGCKSIVFPRSWTSIFTVPVICFFPLPDTPKMLLRALHVRTGKLQFF